jgi:hypothetical protein
MSLDLDKISKGIHRHISEQDFQHGVEAERERIIIAFVERYPNHFVEVIDRGMGETYKSHDNCPQCVAIALIKVENK